MASGKEKNIENKDSKIVPNPKPEKKVKKEAKRATKGIRRKSTMALSFAPGSFY
jgi:hypothetical protein